MPRHQMTYEAHGKLIEFYGELSEVALVRTRLRLRRANDALEGMQDILIRRDSWEPRANANTKTKGTANGQANNY